MCSCSRAEVHTPRLPWRMSGTAYCCSVCSVPFHNPCLLSGERMPSCCFIHQWWFFISPLVNFYFTIGGFQIHHWSFLNPPMVNQNTRRYVLPNRCLRCFHSVACGWSRFTNAGVPARKQLSSSGHGLAGPGIHGREFLYNRNGPGVCSKIGYPTVQIRPV